jgi:SAM-dependent methyltransferase
MDSSTFYDQYWASGLHASREWGELEFQQNMGVLVGRESVLDYGCGMGFAYQRRLVQAVKSYTGADIGSLALETTRKRGLLALPINPETGSVEAPSATFDGATCIEVFEHLFDPLQAARELHRLLKPGGVLVATVPNFGYHAWRLLALLRAQVPSEPENKNLNRFNGVHIRYFSQLMFKRLFREAGFAEVKITRFDVGSVWDIFKAGGHFGHVSDFARNHFPSVFHLHFLEDLWPNVFAYRMRAVARKGS